MPGALRGFLAGGNWLVSGGVLLLFLGVAFALMALVVVAAGWLALRQDALALAVLALLLRRHDAASTLPVAAGHVLGLWLLGGLAAWELTWWFQQWLAPVSSWLRLAWLLAPAALVALVSWRARRAAPWPFDVHARLYLTAGCGPVICALAGGMFALGVGDPGTPWPLPYLPLLNPLDLGLAACAAAGVLWYRTVRGLLGEGARNLLALGGLALAFVWVNGVLLRTLHIWADIAYRFGPLFHSTLVQASVSVLWVLAGLVTMVAGSRVASRAAWAAGAALMGCVVVKLMLVDLANSATVARIVSFVSVGLVLMLVGYLAPVPPRREAAALATSPSST